ncbi:uncharacterized protein PHACADRAFT_260483 [Phanerochaete carnosa HHB-10118-sp]|uniref:Uncharacterized protein n=1 Tax=Phanerochaete carnosa (strain HHB-10118-sp) TaxID=650164 RepID=K5VZI3_PHACS|nr:uncharacterized protein PHACADRAFT_260483 [Phanerochaete carnosa HHB-10118-sp]EKM52245.1 hypothetical protein PHACADRAFT_260483 [Phanerochaete carnosa HHB-10118-sp]
MSSSSPTLPAETIYDIVSIVVVQYLDELLEPSQPTTKGSNKDPGLTKNNPVLPFLIVSLQFRQVTLEVLSDILSIPLRKEGTWRLESKPWTKINPVRKFCATSVEFEAPTLAEVTKFVDSVKSDVLAVYVMLHAVNRIMDKLQRCAVQAVPSLHGLNQLEDVGAAKTLVMDRLPVYLPRCPSAFQSLIQQPMKACLIGVLIAQGYDTPLSILRIQWAQCSAEAVRGVASEASLSAMAKTIRNARQNDAFVFRQWRFNTPFNQAIGAPRFRSWFLLLSHLSSIRGSSNGAAEVKEVAVQLRDLFAGRLLDMGVPLVTDPSDVEQLILQLTLAHP